MSDAPDWDLLPEDPRGFFGLAADFDRKALKRAYNRLIRQYKPERDPRAFQTIREAYEVLEGELRYGKQTTPPSITPRPSRPEREPPARTSAQSAQRLLSDPAGVYDELLALPDKEPPDYYTLALLADVVRPEDPFCFAEHLLAGMAAFPEDEGLYRVMAALCRSQLPGDHVLPLAERVFAVLRDARAYALTEALWRRALSEVAFDVWWDRLREAERVVRGQATVQRTIFLLGLARAAVWRADETWLEETHGAIGDHFAVIADRFEAEMDILEKLIAYRAQAPHFRDHHPLCEAVHRAITAYCERTRWAADRVVLDVCAELRDRCSELGEAFSKSGVVAAAREVFVAIVEDCTVRSRVEPPEEPSVAMDQEIHELIGFLRGEAIRFRIDAFTVPLRRFIGGGLFVIGLPLIAAMILAILLMSRRVGVYTFVLMVPALHMLFWRKLFPRPVSSEQRQIYRGMYGAVGRSQLMAFIRRTGLDWRHVTGALSKLSGERKGFVYYLALFALNDDALALYGAALRANPR